MANDISRNTRLNIVLLSQGEVRPGIKQGQYWGEYRPVMSAPPPPSPDYKLFVDIP